MRNLKYLHLKDLVLRNCVSVPIISNVLCLFGLYIHIWDKYLFLLFIPGHNFITEFKGSGFFFMNKFQLIDLKFPLYHNISAHWYFHNFRGILFIFPMIEIYPEYMRHSFTLFHFDEASSK